MSVATGQTEWTSLIRDVWLLSLALLGVHFQLRSKLFSQRSSWALGVCMVQAADRARTGPHTCILPWSL